MAIDTREQHISLGYLTKQSDLIVAFGVVVVLTIMVLPLPSVLLDIFLSMSISISLVVLLSSLYIKQPLDFSSFPSVLLIITLFRLSLNIASTRLILLHGAEGAGSAGQVIKSFGGFVVGGNYVIGFIIFIILVIINFAVITKGTVRTSEVAARFTLDAMPGKQMSIDADLNAGIISESEARKKRKKLEEEADFYGHMDGAIRFVRGDAIAGIIITVVNIVGGFVIGVLQHNMEIAEAAKVFTVLSIGDGLVSQLPAVIVSTAAGIVVTRSASDASLGTDIVKQLLFSHRIFVLVACALFFLALVPGLPHFSFLLFSAVSGCIAYLIYEDDKVKKQKKREKAEQVESKPVAEKIESLLPLDLIGLEVGYKLIPLVDKNKNGELLERIKSIRRQFAIENGVVVPPLHIRDNLQIGNNKYQVLIKGVIVASGELLLNKFLAMNPGTAMKEIEGIETKEPTFGLPALWIDEKDRDSAQISGYTVVDPATVIITHIKEVIKQYAHEILTRQDVHKLLDTIKETNPKLVEEMIPNIVSLGIIQKVLQLLLREQVSIRDLLTILETLAEYGQFTKDPETLTEFVRQALKRAISAHHQSSDGSMNVITVDKKLEDIVAASIQKSDHGSFLALEPNVAQMILSKLNGLIEKFTIHNYQPIILSSPKIRGQLKNFIHQFAPNLVVLSYNEIVPGITVNTLGVLSM